MSGQVAVEVHRNDPETEPHMEHFDVPHKDGMRVLDALKWIQRHEDGTLAFRWNCGEGICGSCAMEVNGKPVLTCKHELPRARRPVTIRPLQVAENVKDLVHRNERFEELEDAVRPWFNGEEMPDDGYTMDEEAVETAQEMRRCIECNICHASCRPLRDDLVAFPGPRTMVTARKWDEHPKDAGGREEHLEEDGLHNCNHTRCCQINCPQGITITDKAIIPAQEDTQKDTERPDTSTCTECDAVHLGDDCPRCARRDQSCDGVLR